MIYVVYNGFWNPSPPDTVEKLVQAAGRHGADAKAVANTVWHPYIDGDVTVAKVNKTDTVLFFDKDMHLAKALENSGVRVVNTPASIALCDDKAATHLALAGLVPQPKTLIAPMTYQTVDDRIKPFLDASERQLGYPMVVKECYGSLGNQVYLARDRGELSTLAYRMDARPFLTQQYIEAGNTDKRLYVVNGEVVAAMKRHGNGDFRANIGRGGIGEGYTPTADETDLAVACCEHLGLLFGGVDLLTDQNGKTYVCEVNSNAQLTGITAATGIDVAGKIIEAIL